MFQHNVEISQPNKPPVTLNQFYPPQRIPSRDKTGSNFRQAKQKSQGTYHQKNKTSMNNYVVCDNRHNYQTTYLPKNVNTSINTK